MFSPIAGNEQSGMRQEPSRSSSTTTFASRDQQQDQSREKEERPDNLSGGQQPVHDVENPNATKKESNVKDPNLVDWDENDPDNPRNWSTTYKCWITFQLGMLALAASLGSSIISPAEGVISEYVGVSSEVMVLAISMYM